MNATRNKNAKLFYYNLYLAVLYVAVLPFSAWLIIGQTGATWTLWLFALPTLFAVQHDIANYFISPARETFLLSIPSALSLFIFLGLFVWL